ncbi:hypothetical protein P171DRAFT_484670 [Karstenula rhodostoma CBS 690.94]|uniref:F-box domain-containing protein n=1 Tax=Karstenula rhodostoma CBS 690.94 TaxID=1392251 RepID=A0A9P4UEA7_9PLEO|nr:hypothetical protein P171DRAFT_484670 [Karstenula rhodostoma CBS 690.94]
MGNLYSRFRPASQVENTVPVGIPREDLALYLYLPGGLHTRITAGIVLDSPSLDRQTLENQREEARSRDEVNEPPRATLAYSEAESLALDEWRARVSKTIDDRMRRYCNRAGNDQLIPASAKDHSSCQPGAPQVALVDSGAAITRTEHRVLQIPELIENILRFADDNTFLASWNVCSFWRFCVVSRMTRKNDSRAFLMAHPCAAVEYGQELNISWLKPTREEQDAFIKQYQQLIDDTEGSKVAWKYVYPPAVFTQLGDLPEAFFDSLNEYVKFQIPSRAPDSSLFIRAIGIHSFVLNPYFEGLFGDTGRLKHARSKWEITLRDDTFHPLIDPARVPGDFLDLIGPMHITQPPCKALGIYLKQGSMMTNNLELLQWCSSAFVTLSPLHSVRNADGIKAHELLQALQSSVHQLR